MAAPILPIPPLLQAEMTIIKDFLAQIETRIVQAGNLVDAEIGAQRIDLQTQADQTLQRLTELSRETEELDDDVVRLTNLIDNRLRTLIQSSHNIFNVLSLLAWKQIFFAVYIRWILKVLIVLLVSSGTVLYFSSWSASQQVAGWAKEYTALHGRAYSDKLPPISLVSAPAISTTGYSQLLPHCSVTPLDLGVLTGYDAQKPSPPRFLARPDATNTTNREARNCNTRFWWWQRPALIPKATSISIAEIEDGREVAELKEVLSLIIDATEQVEKQVASSVKMSKAAMRAKHRREEIVTYAEASAGQVVKRLRILEELIDRSSSLIDKYASARAK